MTIVIKTTMGGLAAALRATGRHMKGSVKKALRNGALRIKAQTQDAIATTQVDGKNRPPVDTSVFANAFTVHNTPTGAVVGNSSPHAAHVEIGRRPGPVNPAIIEEWVRRKGIASDDKSIKQAVFLITRKIRRDGLTPRFVLKRALHACEDWIRDEIGKAMRGEGEYGEENGSPSPASEAARVIAQLRNDFAGTWKYSGNKWVHESGWHVKKSNGSYVRSDTGQALVIRR